MHQPQQAATALSPGAVRSFLLVWLLANAVSWGLGLLMLPLLLPLAGLLQWAVLAHFLPRVHGWVLATFLGCLGALLYLQVIIIDLPNRSQVTNTLLFALLGLIVGLPQWFCLRRVLQRSALWLVGSAAGYALAWLVWSGSWRFFAALFDPGTLTAPFGLGHVGGQTLLVWYLQGVFCGLAYASVTGLLLRLLSPPATPLAATPTPAATGTRTAERHQPCNGTNAR